MQDIINNLYKAIKLFVANSNLIDLMHIFIVAFTTYFVTKYSTNKPNRLDIARQQFKNVYLPLYKIICINDKYKLSKNEVLKCAIRIKSILYKNYELAFPQLHILLKDLLIALDKDDDYKQILNKIDYQVSIDYEILKNKLGYPSLSTYKIFMRKTKKDKITTILGWLICLYLIPGMFIFSYFMQEFNPAIVMFLYIFIFMILLFLSISATKLKD